MFYYRYKNGGGYIECTNLPTDLSKLEEITEQEYNEYMISIEPTEEEIRAEKEAQIAMLLNDLYPDPVQQEAFLVRNLAQVYDK